jgi:hypothetical protein
LLNGIFGHNLIKVRLHEKIISVKISISYILYFAMVSTLCPISSGAKNVLVSALSSIKLNSLWWICTFY